MRRSYWWIAGSAAVVLVGMLVAVVFWPRGRDLPPARARVYTEASACLLTDSGGIGGPQASPVWSGMQSASIQTRTKVSYLAVYGDDSVAGAVSYVNTLVQRRCDLVIAVGPSEVGAVRQQAPSYPAVRFAVVGTASGSNITAITASGADAVKADTERLVTVITDR